MLKLLRCAHIFSKAITAIILKNCCMQYPTHYVKQARQSLPQKAKIIFIEINYNNRPFWIRLCYTFSFFLMLQQVRIYWMLSCSGLKKCLISFCRGNGSHLFPTASSRISTDSLWQIKCKYPRPTWCSPKYPSIVLLKSDSQVLIVNVWV